MPRDHDTLPVRIQQGDYRQLKALNVNKAAKETALPTSPEGMGPGCSLAIDWEL